MFAAAVQLGMEGAGLMVAIKAEENAPRFNWADISVLAGRIGEPGGRRNDVRAAVVPLRSGFGQGRPVPARCFIDPPATRGPAAETKQFGESIRCSPRAFIFHEKRSQEFKR
ncbi:hypothetical protein AC628_05890 [Bradyrhizobium sp. NAS96.2]|nr:hypothetical protein AC628_05890 [Bradyrhizobium sp. NAS96.2]